ncbi:MAG: type II 3-dehydroquinate dehydratase [Chitinophagaceae bacterium]|nr:type II 3-dehydroquinate dehydratase [Chitinophagaceae bacterium]
MKIAIINGPNLNLIGKRETDIYGGISFDEYLTQLRSRYPGVTIEFYQSNVEGELINAIQQFGFDFSGIILNPGGYTHTSVALGDAIAAITSPVIEVHISNVNAREEFRKISHVSARCRGSIIGLGLRGYELALEWFLRS